MSLVVESNVLNILGFLSLKKGVIINCTVYNVVNPKYSTITSNFNLNIRKKNTNFISETGMINSFIISPN